MGNDDARFVRLLGFLADDAERMTDADVRAELEAEGIDVDAEQEKFKTFLDEQFALRDARMSGDKQ
jgi:hypothetical protein